MKKMKAELVPMVIESSAKGERVLDIYSRLLKDRIIFINGGINDDLAASVVAQLLFLDLDNSGEPIHIYIMSPGGSLDAAFAIYDVMQYVSCPVATYCIGLAASAGAFLLGAGTKGMRLSLPSSRIMIHQPSNGMEGDIKNLEIQYKESERIKGLLYKRMAQHTNKSVAQITKDCDRDRYMTPEDAVKYGIIDRIVTPKAKKKNA